MTLRRLGRNLGAAILIAVLMGCSGKDDADSPDETGGSGNNGGTGGVGGGGGEDSGSGGDESGSGGNALGRGGDGAQNGGAPNPDDKPDPVEDYPCYGERREFAVDSTGQVAAEAHHVLRTFYDEQGKILKTLEDRLNDGFFEFGHYWTYNEAGHSLTWGFDNNGDQELDSRADYFYNDRGQWITADYYNPADQLHSNYSVVYDELRRITLVEVVRTDGTVSQTETYEWLSNWEYNHVISQSGALDEAIHVVLNKYGDFLLEEIWQDENMTLLVSRTTTTYDDFGRPVTVEVEKDVGLSLIESSYAASGLIEKEEITENAVLVAIAEYLYFEECLE
jgi:hypothetical protein